MVQYQHYGPMSALCSTLSTMFQHQHCVPTKPATLCLLAICEVLLQSSPLSQYAASRLNFWTIWQATTSPCCLNVRMYQQTEPLNSLNLPHTWGLLKHLQRHMGHLMHVIPVLIRISYLRRILCKGQEVLSVKLSILVLSQWNTIRMVVWNSCN